MPQLFQVLRCYKCLVFQIHQTKKSSKWECKLCGEKQSIKRHHGIGTSKDCRIHVQKLNCLRGETDELKYNRTEKSQSSDEETKIENLEPVQKRVKVQSSKWSMYIDKKSVEEMSNKVSDDKVILEKPRKCKKKVDNYSTINCNNRNPASLNITENSKPYNMCSLNTEYTHNTFISKTSISANESMPKVFVPVSKTITSNINNEQSTNKKNPVVINKPSKWAQYAETQDDASIMSSSPIENISETDLMFSFCDDSELDAILNII